MTVTLRWPAGTVNAAPGGYAFTGIPGTMVPIEETIRGFNMIIDGEVDQYPEAAFNLKGSIDEAIEAGEKMLKEAEAN